MKWLLFSCILNSAGVNHSSTMLRDWSVCQKMLKVSRDKGKKGKQMYLPVGIEKHTNKYASESWCLWFQPYIITSFHTTVLIFCDRFWKIRMRSGGWWVTFPHSSTNVQIILSSVKLCLSLTSLTASGFIEWDSPSIIKCILRSQKVFVLYNG